MLVDISTSSTIGKQEFQVVHPHARRLNSKNDRARSKYLCHLEAQMATHKKTHCLEECEQAIQGYPSLPNKVKKMEALDKQMVEMQLRKTMPTNLCRKPPLQRTSTYSSFLAQSIPGAIGTSPT